MKLFSLAAAGLLAFAGCAGKESVQPTTPATNISPLPALAAGDAVLYEVFIANFSAAGTLDGMLPRLDSIRRVGGNVVWLMPPYPTRGSPYAVDDYRRINPEFGNLAAFDALVAAAHARGLRVMLDWVANHTSFHHPWIQTHPDWYTRDATGRIVHPTPQWTDVADLDYNQAGLRQEMIESMKFWVTQHGVDGFRCDAADLLPDDFWRQALLELRQANPNLLLLAEGSRASHYASGFDMAFGWDFHTALHHVFVRREPASRLIAAHRQEMKGLATGRTRLRFTTNHDEVQAGIPAVRFGSEAAARAAYVATVAFGATPLLYNGQEAGDPARMNAQRTPIRWGLDPTAGLFYRGLLNVYQRLPALRRGSVEDLSASTDVLLVHRRLGTEEVLVLVNVRGTPTTVALPMAVQGATWTNALTAAPVAVSTLLTLPAYGYALWQR
ncbi:DUF3459 domain-containing protein [Hymenobacter sp. NST-14]|uniref:alpha-amylase family glycosyl hydrolase n=1 Tax=Hymenobacter piscis TaxID=2839984 RepID=UPI001C014093|nr:alpha-amylase family glycosyl hydrolase [Hymenobacter piscis]MBT9395317.1 DUF3459 domain-containing protein [Hymenobacter piscis]